MDVPLNNGGIKRANPHGDEVELYIFIYIYTLW